MSKQDLQRIEVLTPFYQTLGRSVLLVKRSFQRFADPVAETLGITLQVAKRSHLHSFAVMPPTMSRRTLLRPARQVQTTVEELRTQTRHQPVNVRQALLVISEYEPTRQRY